MKKFKDLEKYKNFKDPIAKKSIYIYLNELESLEGSPKVVRGNFNCSDNQLTSLEFSPEEIGNNFNCSNNKLTSLKGNIKLIKNIFYCNGNPNLKNVKKQIIKYQIKAFMYYTDEGDFYFDEIKKEFEKETYRLNILKNKPNINKNDYGFSL